MKREEAVEYSFILGIPVILAGAVVKLGEPGALSGGGVAAPLVGFTVAAAVGYFSIRLVKRLAVTGRFAVFAWYTLFIGLAAIAAGLVLE
jgi:undecaprenyl-diphosphatase